jgi:cathepsin B
MGSGKNNQSIDVDELERRRQVAKESEAARLSREESSRQKITELKAKRMEEKQNIIKKKSQKSFWDEWSYWIIGGAVTLVIVYLLWGGNPADSREYKEIPINEDYYLVRVNSDNRKPFKVGNNPAFDGWSLQEAEAITKNNLEHSGMKSPARCEYTTTENLPDKFDLRKEYPSCFGVAVFQGMCSSSFSLAATSAINSRLCILANSTQGAPKVETSAMHGVVCQQEGQATNKCETGGTVQEIFELAKTSGLVNATCLPYNSERADVCEKDLKTKCPQTIKIDNYCKASGVMEIKRMLMTGTPVVALVRLTRDFMIYKDSIYDPTRADYVLSGYHAVKIVGWERLSKHWGEIWHVENTFGTSWGLHGYGRIKIDAEDSVTDQAALVPLLK